MDLNQLTPVEPFSLKPGALKRKPTNQGGAELLALQADLALLNNPEITGAVLSKEEKADNLRILQGASKLAPPSPSGATAETMNEISPPAPILPDSTPVLSSPVINSPEPITPEPAMIPTPPATAPTRVLLTGRSGAGKSFLAEQAGFREYDLFSPVWGAMKEFFPVATPQDSQLLVNTIRAWGDGWITKEIPMTPARMLFVKFARDYFGPGFGVPGFWVKKFLDYLDEEEAVNGLGKPAAVTMVTTTADFQALSAAGFKHFHVMASIQSMGTRAKRQNADDRLAASLDNDVVKKISQQRQGQRLRCIWSDNLQSPNPSRLYSVADWVAEVSPQPQEQINNISIE